MSTECPGGIKSGNKHNLTKLDTEGYFFCMDGTCDYVFQHDGKDVWKSSIKPINPTLN